MPEDKSQPENQTQPQQTYGPAPVAPSTPYQQQPVNQQYFGQPQAAPVQYVVHAESLKGIKGWLLVFTIGFALAGLGYLGVFFTSISVSASADSIISAIFAPILAAAFFTTVVFVAMQKKLGKWLAIGTLALGAFYTILENIVNFASNKNDSAVSLIASIVFTLVIYGLYALYFFTSRRVKETLVA